MERGEVWWADLPLPVGRRPVLILTRTAAVDVRNQIVVAQVTRTTHNLASEVAVMRAEGMPADSFVNCDVLLTVPKALMLRQVTKLSTQKITEIDAALKFAMDIK